MPKSFFIAVVCLLAPIVFPGHSFGYDSHGFCSAPGAPIEEIICYDDAINALDGEMAILYFNYHDDAADEDKADILHDQRQWLSLRHTKCNVPKIGSLTAYEVLRSRTCLIDLYKERISQLSDDASKILSRLNDRPDDLTDGTAYFTMVSSRDSEQAGEQELERLRKAFPYIDFDLFPPYGDGKYWAVVIASYTNEADAVEARQAAKAFSIADDAFVWRIPQPLETAHLWLAAHDDTLLPKSVSAKKIIDCYTQQVADDKTTTVFAVYQCSDLWVSPKALISCAIADNCPVLPDTVEGRATIDAVLSRENMNIYSNLVLDPNKLPRLPTADNLNGCKKTEQTDAGYENCVSATVLSNYDPLVQCFSKLSDGEKLSCFANQVNNDDFTNLIRCLGGGARLRTSCPMHLPA